LAKEALNLERKKTILLVCFILTLLISLFSIRLLSSNEQPQSEEYKILAEQLLSDSREEFENIRGIPVREVTLEVVNQSWVNENWGAPYIDIEEITVEENIYKSLFLITKDVNLTDLKLDWVAIFRAAEWRGNIYLVQENIDITDEFMTKSTLIHELTHIMQQKYSLPTRTTFDGSKALTSLKEGDATLMADTFKNNGIVPPLAEVSISGTSSLPESINKINRFVYRYGVEFVKTLYEQGGWEAVNGAYTNPPSTTEQIIHPDKYLLQEGALNVEATSVADGWNLKKTNRLGEYFLQVMLDNWLSTDEAEQAAEGWAGDIINYYEKDSDFLFTWNIAWDSKDDAHEFYLTFQELMFEISAEKKNCSHWFADGRYISIQWKENLTLIISSANEMLVQQPFLE
jgi:hypothetical protein